MSQVLGEHGGRTPMCVCEPVRDITRSGAGVEPDSSVVQAHSHLCPNKKAMLTQKKH